MSQQFVAMAGPPAAAAMPATYMCRCAGICSPQDVEALYNVLKGMCIRRVSYDENEYGMTFPLQSGTKQGAFKMIKQVPTSNSLVPLGPGQPVIWRLVHESPPLRGNPYNSLPALVLEVTETALGGIFAVQFMYAMGCTHTYRITRRNQIFMCQHEGVEVLVSVYAVFDRNTHQPLFEGQMVEARLTAGPEQQMEAARKLGTFCQKLLPMVLLKKA
eukprot:GHRR01013448.1.p1 GENE.GHRR01013448.1~~GHRR01013448.1.p1  ORF type:complete len:216 (+),score=53.07 GHRR01013448.1:230-877(+)